MGDRTRLDFSVGIGIDSGYDVGIENGSVLFFGSELTWFTMGIEINLFLCGDRIFLGFLCGGRK